MKKRVVRTGAVLAALLFLSLTALEYNAEARAGGSRSMRSYSRPVAPASQQNQSRQQYSSAPGPLQQPAGGGFMRSMAGGMMGGMAGSMLFSSFAGAGSGMGTVGGGGGIGLFEIILLTGGGYLIYRYIKKKRAES